MKAQEKGAVTRTPRDAVAQERAMLALNRGVMGQAGPSRHLASLLCLLPTTCWCSSGAKPNRTPGNPVHREPVEAICEGQPPALRAGWRRGENGSAFGLSWGADGAGRETPSSILVKRPRVLHLSFKSRGPCWDWSSSPGESLSSYMVLWGDAQRTLCAGCPSPTSCICL